MGDQHSAPELLAECEAPSEQDGEDNQKRRQTLISAVLRRGEYDASSYYRLSGVSIVPFFAPHGLLAAWMARHQPE
jgi:hypothetical protein